MERMGFDDAAMRQVELSIAAAPQAGRVIQGLRGVRKSRFRLPGRGKSGGGRVIYYFAVTEIIYMMTAYQKSERDDLSPDQRKAILAIIESLKGGAR